MSDHSLNCPDQNLPPRDVTFDNERSVFSTVTGAAASSADIWAGYTADAGGIKSPPGKVWIELEATGSVAYVRFTNAATTATTVANGAVLNVGVPRRFYVDPSKDLFLDLIAAGVGSVKWRRVGAIVTRSRA